MSTSPPSPFSPVPVIDTKLRIPPSRATLVMRQRLFERLEDGKNEKLTLLSASAGFGKTTMLSQWCHKTGAKVAWVSLESDDNDLARFWSYVILALQSCIPSLGQTALALLHSPQPPPARVVLTALLNDASRQDESLILVLDDYHVIEEKSIHESMMFFLEHLPATLHLFLAGRIDPPLPLARLRVRERIIEIRDSDLRFTPEEALTFLTKSMGLPLSQQDVAALEAKTEGWIAGLHLAAISIQHRPNPGELVRAFTGSHRFILDYLVDEVLHRQPSHIQEFLLRTAFLSRFNAALCEAITGQPDCQSTLEALERNNVFIIPLDDERQWYRYHALFSDVLQARLLATERNLLPTLHEHAARWYEQHALYTEAVHHALAARAYPYAAQLIEASVESIWRSGALTTFIAWIEALPEAVLHSRLRLCTYYVWMLYLTLQTKTAIATMAFIEEELARLDPTNEDVTYHDVRGLLAAIQATLAVMKGERERVITLSQQALAQIP